VADADGIGHVLAAGVLEDLVMGVTNLLKSGVVARGLVHGGGAAGLAFYIGGSAFNLFYPHAFDPITFANGFGVTLGSVTASVIGHSRYYEGGSNGVSDQSNTGP
jgi:hypothetical protein